MAERDIKPEGGTSSSVAELRAALQRIADAGYKSHDATFTTLHEAVRHSDEMIDIAKRALGCRDPKLCDELCCPEDMTSPAKSTEATDFAPQAFGLLALKATAEQVLRDLGELDEEFVSQSDCDSAPDVVGCRCPRCRCDNGLDRIQAFASSIIRSCESALDDAGVDHG